MPNEKHINSWKDKLNDLSALPGEDPRRMEKSWEKLDARLHAKKEKQRFRWYWVAAAGILLFVTVSILRENQTGSTAPGIVKNDETKARPEKIKQATTSESSTAIVTTPQLPKEKTKQTVANKLHTAYTLPALKDSALPVQLLPIEKDSVHNVAGIPGSLKERRVIFTSLKKKIPVVHLNELEKPIPAVEAVAGNNDRPAPRIRFFNRNVSPASPVSNDAGNNIITIKLPPLN